MAALADRALAYARARRVDLSRILAEVKGWYSVDSTMVAVRDGLREEFPGTGAYAALKVHQVLSVGCGAPVRYQFSPTREHDRWRLQIDVSWQGWGLLADLVYISLARLRACHVCNGRVVICLKDNWKPNVEHIARGQVTQEFLPGSDLNTLLDGHIFTLNGRATDADVRVANSKHPLHLRLVWVNTRKGYGFFLTNLPPTVGPRQVADLYCVRWDVELRMKMDKSVHRLDQFDAEPSCAAKALLHAPLMASIIAALLAYSHRLQTRPSHEGRVRTEAPPHLRRLVLRLAVSCQVMAPAFAPTGTAAKRRWQQIAVLPTPSGKDPNGRRRPSVLEQVCSWKRNLSHLNRPTAAI
jgi:Transposase DDE domain